MGRSIKMVPPNWVHPISEKYHDGGYQPLYDSTFENGAKKWKEGFAKYQIKPDDPDLEYWEWEGGPPDREYYRTYKDEEATWFQVYETVSEGTPVTPPFATREELVQYLVKNGDFWDQNPGGWGFVKGQTGWKEENARRFVMGSQSLCSMAIVDGAVLNPKEM